MDRCCRWPVPSLPRFVRHRRCSRRDRLPRRPTAPLLHRPTTRLSRATTASSCHHHHRRHFRPWHHRLLKRRRRLFRRICFSRRLLVRVIFRCRLPARPQCLVLLLVWCSLFCAPTSRPVGSFALLLRPLLGLLPVVLLMMMRLVRLRRRLVALPAFASQFIALASRAVR